MSDTEAPRSTKPFGAWLQEQRGSGLHGELSDALADVARAVSEHGKAGSLTLTVKLKPSKIDGAVEVEDDIKVKVPQADRGAALFFVDGDGNLSRRDPRQPELPLRDAAADADAA